MRSERMCQAAVAGILLAALGCASDSSSRTPERPSDQAPTSREVDTSATPLDEFGAPNTLLLLSCVPEAGGVTMSISLSAIAATDGEPRGTRQVTLSGLRSSGDLAGPCPEGPRRRHHFNEDFSQVAVLISGPNGAGERAVAADIPSGEILGPAPEEDAFTTSPDDSRPMFDPQTGDLWYIDENSGRVLSRPAEASATEAVDHGDAHGSNHVVAVSGGNAWVGFNGDEVAVNPSGTYGALPGFGFGMVLWRQGTDPHEDEITFYSLNGGEEVPSCTPELWIDDHSLLCNGGGLDDPDVYHQVSLSQDYSTVVDVQPLIPATDRRNEDPVLSPNGDSFAFVSTQGTDRAVYVQDLGNPAADPIKVADLTGEEILIAWL